MVIIYLLFIGNQIYIIYKIKKRKKILDEYIKLTDIIFDFYKKRNITHDYYNEYKWFEIIINRFIRNSNYKDVDSYKKDIQEIKELYKDIIPEIKKEYRQEKLKRALKF